MPNPSIHCLIVRSRINPDPRAAGLLADAHALGIISLTGLECSDLYFLEGDLNPDDLQRLATELLSDSVAQTSEWRNHSSSVVRRPSSVVLETALRPGVTDPVAEQIVRCAKVLGIQGVEHAATGQSYKLHGRLKEKDLHTLAKRLLANPVIQRYALGEIEPAFPRPAEASGQVDFIPVRELEPDELLALSRDRRAALDLAEMQAIQNYYRTEGRDPTDVEFETIAQTWSEHCVHKTFKAKIALSNPKPQGPNPKGQGPNPKSQIPRAKDQGLRAKSQEPNPKSQLPATSDQQPAASRQPPAADHQINNLLNTFLRSATESISAPWVRSAFVDNAGIIDFDDEYEISFKVETHNHPSAVEPFGGANTGVGGVIRDVLGVSAKPIAATDILCFGPQDLDPKSLPEGVLHPRRIRSGVVAGVQDYGNKIGIPTVNGAILYDLGYTANPLVFCGCVGLAPKNKHPREPQPGDRVIVLGGRTGRDGLRGATFSSMTMDAQTGEVAGASVQIGDPITEKGLIEVIVRARDEALYHAITDCGAGGLSSAVGEMASKCGADVDLTRVRLKYPGLAPWEIWLSEAQERMVLAVSDSSLTALQVLCDTFDVELTDIGGFTSSGRLIVRYGDKLTLDLANNFLHDGIPQRQLAATIKPSTPNPQPPAASHQPPATILLKLLSHPNIASKADVIRIYDHEVQGGTAVKPLTGALNDGPSDACVLKPLGTRGTRGIVLSNGINPEFGKIDPYRMAVSVVDEAVRNAVAVGADPDRIALLDNFCWGDPLRPETLGGLVEAARGCHDAALHYRAPFISGKDSLNNEYLGADGLRHAIPPSLLISAIGLIENVNQAVTMDLKEAGNAVYLLGETRAELGGSHVLGIGGWGLGTGEVPTMPEHAPALYRALHRAMRAGLVRACHDLSEGGLAVAAAEMCIGGRLGLAVTLETDDPLTALFSESNGRFLIEVRSADAVVFESQFSELLRPLVNRIGVVTGGPRLTITTRDQELLSLSVAELVNVWQHPEQRARPSTSPRQERGAPLRMRAAKSKGK